MQIDFISILLFLGMGQCLFLMGTILIDRQRFKIANLLLFALLFAFLWYQSEFFLLRHTLDSQIPFLYSTRYGSWFLIGPLVLLYNRATLIEDFQLQLRDGRHFLPFLIFTVALPLLFGGFVTDRAIHYGMLTVFDSYNQELITWKHYLYGAIFLLQFIHAAAYIFWAFRETQDLEETAKQEQSYLPAERIHTLKYLYLSSFVIIGLCSAFVLYIFLTTMWRRNMDYLYVLPMLVLVFGLAYRAMKYPNSVLIFETETGNGTPKYVRSGLSEEAKRKYLQELDEKLKNDKIYKRNQLRLSDLAEEMEMSSHHLSQIINEEKQKNFFDFINSYRVREAQERIALGEGHTLLEVALEVGFNNKNSFNTAFKKHAGMTPSSYKKGLRKA